MDSYAKILLVWRRIRYQCHLQKNKMKLLGDECSNSSSHGSTHARLRVSILMMDSSQQETFSIYKLIDLTHLFQGEIPCYVFKGFPELMTDDCI